jgi:response regulator RpfG family c-di-GMP phosphodiesterase
MSPRPHKILIVEDDLALRELLILVLGGQFNAQFFEAESDQRAIQILESQKQLMDIIVSDFNMPNGNGGTLAKYVRSQMPDTPFLLVSSDDRRDHEEILSLPFMAYIEKPFDDSMLSDEVNRLLAAKAGQDENEEPRYMPISLHSLERLRTLECPVFLKLSENHYIKILGEKDVFDDEVYKRFLAKDLQYLYINKIHFETVLNRFRNLVKDDIYISAIKSKKTEALKLSKTVQELVSSATRAFGWNEQVLALGSESIQLIQNLVKHDSNLGELFDWFSEDSHDVGVLAGLLLIYTLSSITNELKPQNPRALDYLSMAAFLHDLPLSDHLIRNQRKFLKAIQLGIPANKQESEKIRLHSEATKETLLKWPNCPKEVITIIEKHNERPDGRGFPFGIEGKDIDELTGIFIVANEIVQLYLNHRDPRAFLAEFAGSAELFAKADATRAPFAIALKQLTR